MFNAMKYIKALEAAGFERNQAEAQVQLVLDAMEGEFVSKSDLVSFREHTDARFNWMENQLNQISHRFDQVESKFDRKLVELEFRMTTRLSMLTVSSMTIAVAILAWIIKIH